VEEVVDHVGGVLLLEELRIAVLQERPLRRGEPQDEGNLDVGVWDGVGIVVTSIVALVVDVLPMVGEVECADAYISMLPAVDVE